MTAGVILYWCAWSFVSFTSTVWLVLACIAHMRDRPSGAPRVPRCDEREWPFVTVQVPVFNDAVAIGAIESLLAQDYPSDRFEILIADDSTEQGVVSALRARTSSASPQIRHLHRSHRDGWKPGALEAALRETRGEIIVVLDADWRPRPDFLRHVVAPFDDASVAIVQTREGFFVNAAESFVTRFAAALLWGHHAVMMRAARALGAVFFCGTGGAIRTRALREVGGWNVRSITEDADLSVRLLRAGHRSVYLDYDIVSEVPKRVMDFVHQQCRWCFGITQIFFRDPKRFLFARDLRGGQRFIVVTWLLAHMASLSSLLYVLACFAMAVCGWITHAPFDVPVLAYIPPVLGPYLSLVLGLRSHDRLRWLPSIALSSITIGLFLTVRCTHEMLYAAIGGERGWVRTPKSA